MATKKRTPQQRGKWSRNKGARAERDVARLLSKGLEKLIERKLGASRAGGSDIEIDHIVYTDGHLVMRTHPGWSIEVKHHNTLKVDAWWSQCVSQADLEEKRPLLVFKKDRSKWNFMYLYDSEPVITDYPTWLELYKDYTI
jgi:hypothetical protein